MTTFQRNRRAVRTLAAGAAPLGSNGETMNRNLSPTARGMRGVLAAGVTLIGTSLASAQVPALLFSTVDSASGTMSIGGVDGSFSFTGPTTSGAGMYASNSLSPGSASGRVGALAYGYANSSTFGGSVDFFYLACVSFGPDYSTGVANVTFTLTLASSVAFRNLSLFGFLATWTEGSTTLSDGDLLAAGTHTIDGSFSLNGSSSVGAYRIGFLLSAPPAPSPVPLPGAAGLAACGLVGLSRRRRRG